MIEGEKMKKSYLLFLLLFAANIIHAQGWDWKQYYEGSYLGEVSADSSGNVYVKGILEKPVTFGNTTLSPTQGKNTYFIAKCNAAGQYFWARSFDIDYNPNWSQHSLRIAVAPAGDIFLYGSFESYARIENTQINSRGGTDIFIAKYNSSGTFQWLKHEGGAYGEYPDAATCDKNGDLFITGSYDSITVVSGVTFTNTYNRSFFFQKYDANGNLLWSREADKGEMHISSIKTDASGNAYLMGTASTDTSIGGGLEICGNTLATSTYFGSVVVLRFDNNGNCIDLKDLGSPYWGVNVMGVDDAGNMYFSRDNKYDKFDLWKYDRDWNMEYHVQPDAMWMYCKGLQPDNDGNLYVNGTFSGYFMAGNDSLQGYPNSPPSAGFVTKLNSQQQWEWAVQCSAVLDNMTLHRSGNIYTGGAGYDKDQITFGADPMSCPGYGFTLARVTANGTLEIGDNKKENSYFDIYPNPAKGGFKVSCALENMCEVKLTIYDVTGKAVHTQVYPAVEGARDYTVKFNSSPGIYMVEVAGDDEHWVKRVVVE